MTFSAQKTSLFFLRGALAVALLTPQISLQAQESPTTFPIRKLRMGLHEKQGFNFRVDVQENAPLEVDFPGDFQEPRLEYGLKSIEIHEDSLVLHDLYLRVSGENWHYKEGPFLELNCTRPQAILSFPRWSARLPQNFKLQIKSEASSARLRLVLSKWLEKWIQRALENVFSAEQLARHLRFEAGCPGKSHEIIEDLLRARLAEWPRKDKKVLEDFFRPLRENGFLIESSKSSAVFDEFREVFLDSSEGLNFELHFRYESSRKEWIIQTSHPQESSDLSPQARDQWSELRPAQPESLLGLIGQSELDDLTTRIFKNLEQRWRKDPASLPSTLSFTEEGAFRLDFKDHGLRAKELAYFLPELEKLPEHVPVQVVLELRDCDENDSRLVAPRLRPWFSTLGLSAGLDLIFKGRLQFFNKKSGRLLTERMLSAVPFVFSYVTPRNKEPYWKFGKARITQAGAEGCSIPELPAELALSLEWLLNGEAAHDLLNEYLEPLNKLQKNQGLRFYFFGQTSLGQRREWGGYFAEALAVEWPLSP